MRTLLALLLMLYIQPSEPEQIRLQWWQVLGEPCTTKIDRIEGTCGDLEIKTKVEWE
jgi:hypothetical protein